MIDLQKAILAVLANHHRIGQGLKGVRAILTADGWDVTADQVLSALHSLASVGHVTRTSESCVWTITEVGQQEQTLQDALHLIKIHIGAEQTEHNRDLHNAIGKIVDVARLHGLLNR